VFLDLQEITKIPLFAPLDLGANFTVPTLLCPGANVRGNVQPCAENAAPVTLNRVIVSLDFPEFFRISSFLPVLPTAIVPNLTVQGLGISWPEVCAIANVDHEARKRVNSQANRMKLRRRKVLLTVLPLSRRNASCGRAKDTVRFWRRDFVFMTTETDSENAALRDYAS
jgi:hypothetical protein